MTEKPIKLLDDVNPGGVTDMTTPLDRTSFAGSLVHLLKISTWSILALTFVLAALDAWFIYNGKLQPADRLVTEKVLMAVVAGSIAQVGAASLALANGFSRSAKGSKKKGKVRKGGDSPASQ